MHFLCKSVDIKIHKRVNQSSEKVTPLAYELSLVMACETIIMYSFMMDMKAQSRVRIDIFRDLHSIPIFISGAQLENAES